MFRKYWQWIWIGSFMLLIVQHSAQGQPVCDASAPVWEEAVRMSEFEPGSALIFPLYDARDGGSITIHTVTNLNYSRVRADNTYLSGDVMLHYFYFSATECLVFNRYEFLTPGDTLSVVASDHNPENDYGYMLVRAEDPETGLMIDFDYLIGDQVVVDPRGNYVWTIPAMGFRALTQERFDANVMIPDQSGTGHAFTDIASNDGDEDEECDFNGYEYAYFPDKLLISSFFEESAQISTELILLTPLDPLAKITLSFWFFNNEETRFSRSFQFSCFWNGSLSEISNIVRNLEGDPDELPLPLETGWAVIDGKRATLGSNIISNDPPVLGFQIQLFRGPGGQIATARPLHHQGFQCGDDL